MPERDDARAGQRRDVDEMRRAELLRVPQPSPRISRPSASVLITSTVLPLAPVRMSPGLIARPPGMFSVVGHDADDADRRVEQRDGAHGADDGGAAGHVVLHPLHAVRRLDRDAAGVERDALPDQSQDRRVGRAGRLVAQHDQARRLDAAARDARAAVPCRDARSPSRRGSRRATPAARAMSAARSANTRGVSTFDGSLAKPRARLLDSPENLGRARRPARAHACRRRARARRRASSAAGGPNRSPVLYWSTLKPASTSPSVTAWAASRTANRPAQQERHPRDASSARDERRGRRDLAQAFEVEVCRPCPRRRAQSAWAGQSGSTAGVTKCSYSRALISPDVIARPTSPPVALSSAGSASAGFSASKTGTTRRSVSTRGGGFGDQTDAS